MITFEYKALEVFRLALKVGSLVKVFPTLAFNFAAFAMVYLDAVASAKSARAITFIKEFMVLKLVIELHGESAN